jgi:sarcosine oxidase
VKAGGFCLYRHKASGCPRPGCGNDAFVDFLIVGNEMFGAAAARYLSPYAKVTVVGPEARADGSRGYGAHHDEGRIIGDLSRDIVWSELNRRARDGMTRLDPALITPCGALTVTTGHGPSYLSVADQLRQHSGADIRTLTADAARAGFPMARFGREETILHQPAAGHFNPRRYVTLATKSAQGNGATIIPGTVRALRICATGIEAELGDGRLLHAETAIVAGGAFAAGSDLLSAQVTLRAKSEIYAMAELDDQQAAALSEMPCITRTISHPQLADLCVLPPIRYPDGRTYLKFGANTVTDRWLPDPAAVRAWYDHGDGDGLPPDLRGILTACCPTPASAPGTPAAAPTPIPPTADPTSTSSNQAATSPPTPPGTA